MDLSVIFYASENAWPISLLQVGRPSVFPPLYIPLLGAAIQRVLHLVDLGSDVAVGVRSVPATCNKPRIRIGDRHIARFIHMIASHSRFSSYIPRTIKRKDNIMAQEQKEDKDPTLPKCSRHETPQLNCGLNYPSSTTPSLGTRQIWQATGCGLAIYNR